jgi:hypothetical protein
MLMMPGGEYASPTQTSFHHYKDMVGCFGAAADLSPADDGFSGSLASRRILGRG